MHIFIIDKNMHGFLAPFVKSEIHYSVKFVELVPSTPNFIVLCVKNFSCSGPYISLAGGNIRCYYKCKL